MTTEQNVDTAIADAVTEASEEKPDIRRMRARIEALETENAELAGKAMATAFEKAGLDPSSGVGKLLFNSYEGLPEAQAIAEYAASEYSIDVNEAPSAAATAQVQFEERIDAVQAVSTSVPPESDLDTQLQEAATSGDWQRYIALQTQQHNE